MHRKFDASAMQRLNGLIQGSLAYAQESYPQLSDFVTSNAQEMKTEIMLQHIDLYVNEYSNQLGKVGKEAIIQLLENAHLLYPEPVTGSFDIFQD